MTVTKKFDSKVTPIGALHAEKLAEEVLLYAFRITFPVSSLKKNVKWNGKENKITKGVELVQDGRLQQGSLFSHSDLGIAWLVQTFWRYTVGVR